MRTPRTSKRLKRLIRMIKEFRILLATQIAPVTDTQERNSIQNLLLELSSSRDHLIQVASIMGVQVRFEMKGTPSQMRRVVANEEIVDECIHAIWMNSLRAIQKRVAA